MIPASPAATGASTAPPPISAALSISKLTYEYPSVRALDDISFQVVPGSITALVGPNGSGKTTLLRCLAALEMPLAGEIRVMGVDTLRAPREVHRHLGYMPETFGVYDMLTVEQCLVHAARRHYLPPLEEREGVLRAASRVGLDDRMGTLAGELSRGLRQRLALAQAILHRPRVMLLDEPAANLDPEARLALAKLLRRLGDDGATIIVSSHILAELEHYSTHLLILDKGRVVEHHALDGSLKTGEDGMVVATPPQSWRLDTAAPFGGLLSLLREQPEVVEVDWLTPDPDKDSKPDPLVVAGLAVRVTLKPEATPETRHQLLRRLIEAGAPVAGLTALKTSLQDAYLARLQRARTENRAGEGWGEK